MLRHFDQHQGGVRVYTRRVLNALLDLDSPHEFVLLYRNPTLLNTYGGRPRVEEHALERRYGAAYREFKSSVPRFLGLPRKVTRMRTA